MFLVCNQRTIDGVVDLLMHVYTAVFLYIQPVAQSHDFVSDGARLENCVEQKIEG